MLVGLGYDVGVFFYVKKFQLEFFSIVEAAKKRSRGSSPKNNTLTIVFQELTMVRSGVGEFK